jgi:hypothetical protein
MELLQLNAGMRVVPKHDAYVLVNSQNGISVQQHKSSVCRVYSQPLTIRDSQLRLERVRGFPRGPDSTSAETFGVTPGDSPEPFFRVEDPAALLVRSKDLIWLAVVEIYGIKQGGISLARLPTRLLGEPNIQITVRITRLAQRATPNDDGDWEWFGSFEKATIDVEGRWLQLLDPAVIRLSRDEVIIPGYGFHSAELVAIATLLYGNFRSDLDRFPSVPWTDNFPYRLQNGVLTCVTCVIRRSVVLTYYLGAICFICEDNTSSRGAVQTQHRCSLCPSLPLTVKPPGKLIEHIATHVLHDPVVKARYCPCGFCGGSGDSCVVYIAKGKGSQGAHYVDVSKSRCKNGNVVKLSLAAGEKSTMSSPCTNVPLACPLCPSMAPAIWKYNLAEHISHVHPTADASSDDYKSLYAVGPFEVSALKVLWLKKPRYTTRKFRNLGNLNISDSHSTHLSAPQ